MQTYNDTIESFVIHSGLVSRPEVSESLEKAKKQGIDLGVALLQAGKISEDDLSKIYAHSLGVPFVNLESNIPLEILSIIPEPISRQQGVVAYNIIEDGIEVAILNLNSLETLRDLQNQINTNIFPRFTTSESVKRGLLTYQRKLKNQFGDEIQKGLSSESISISSVVNTLLKHAIIQNASDIHIEPREKMLAVRYRILGGLKDAMMLPLDSAAKISSEIKKMAGMNFEKIDMPQDGRFSFRESGHNVSIRASIFPTFYGEKITLRISRHGTGKFSLEGLGCDGKTLEDIQSVLHKKRGIAIFAGQPRSGISTTLYSVLDILNKPSYSISTIEDSIEYNVPHVNQTQVRKERGISMAEGLRSILLQDPDVVMVSSCDDSKILDLMTTASRTGKLIISSMVSRSAPEALVKILSNSDNPESLLNQLEIVTYQRLVKRLADSKEEYFLSEAGLKALAKIIDTERLLNHLKKEKIVGAKATWKTIPFYRPVSSPGSASGYKGVVGIFETLPITNSLRDAVCKDFTLNTIVNNAYKEGFISIIEDGIIKAVQGYTTLDEIIRAA